MTKRKRYRLTPSWRDQFTFGPEDVVDLFLKVSHKWFTDKSNQLYGMRKRCRKVLLTYLREGRDTAEHFGEIYVLNKFRREWLDLFQEAS